MNSYRSQLKHKVAELNFLELQIFDTGFIAQIFANKYLLFASHFICIRTFQMKISALPIIMNVSKNPDIFSRDDCANICKQIFVILKSNFTMNGASAEFAILNFFTRQDPFFRHPKFRLLLRPHSTFLVGFPKSSKFFLDSGVRMSMKYASDFALYFMLKSPRKGTS